MSKPNNDVINGVSERKKTLKKALVYAVLVALVFASAMLVVFQVF